MILLQVTRWQIHARQLHTIAQGALTQHRGEQGVFNFFQGQGIGSKVPSWAS